MLQKFSSIRWSRLFVYFILLSAMIYVILPLFIMVITSLKTSEEIRTGNLISLPKQLYLEAWIKAWSTACTGLECQGIKNYFWNSVKIVVPPVLISTIIGALNGYVLSKWKFRYSEFFFGMLLIGCFIPFQIVILPMAQVLGKIGLANTIWGVIFVHIVYGLAFTTLFYRNYFIAIPEDLIKAAKMDGAGFFTIFWRILMPVSLPITMVTLIWQFTNIWNDFLFGVIFSSGDIQPVTVALNNLVNTSTGVKEYNVDMAAAIFAGLPTLLIYVLAGKYFVKGLTAGTVKG